MATTRRPLRTPVPYDVSTFLLFVCIHCFFSFAASETKSFLYEGSSLSVSEDPDLLTSPDGTFSCGFYSTGGKNAYWFSIWFTHSRNRTVVWMANREKPVSGQGSKLSLRHGVLTLTNVDGSTVWQNDVKSSEAVKAELLPSGNLVLKDPSGKILWQSFDFPTDTLLPNQNLTRGARLVSNKAEKGRYSSGYFSLYFDSDNLLKLMYDGPEISSIYWPNPDYDVFQNGRTNYNSSRIASLDEMGRFSSSDQLEIIAADMGLGVKRRLTVDYDGNLRLYSLNNLTGLWVVTWQALEEQCKVHGLCGRNGICVYTPKPKCSCPPGFVPSVQGDWSKGCKPKFNRSCSHLEQVKFVELAHVDYYGYDLNYTESISIDRCKEICMDDCHCQAFGYRSDGEGKCYPKLELFNGYRSTDFPGSIYLKLPTHVETSEVTVLNGSDPVCSRSVTQEVFDYPSIASSGRVKWAYFYWFISTIGVIEILFITSGWWFLFRKRGFAAMSVVEDGYHAISSQFRRFSWRELMKATQKFKEELGRGGFGIVHRGVLTDERVVAVKSLANVTQGEEEFWAEVSSLGKLNHMNLVRMWGFCCEGKHRLLVYEYIENGSLDKHLFFVNSLGWKERFKVAVGTARGLAYLHHECLEWIIHCDVKPANILLDHEFEPKIADFGLAKLSQRGGPGSQVSRIRGTKGYMAPEWALNLPITAKVDVYSYGVVILEMVRGFRFSSSLPEDREEQEAGLVRFTRAVKGKMECGEEECSWVEDIVDPRLNGEFSRKQAAKLIEVGILCVEEERNKRPTMDWVVQVLLECGDETRVLVPNLQLI